METQIPKDAELSIDEIKNITATDQTIDKVNTTLLGIMNDKAKSKDFRREALWKYSSLNREKALPQLQLILEDKTDKDLHYNAIHELSRIQHKDVVKPLLAFSKEKEFKGPALEGLARLGVRECWPQIIDQIINLTDSYRKKYLAEAFREGAESDWESRFKAMVQFLKEKNVSSGNVDSFVVVEAIRPEQGWPKNQDVLISYLIKESMDQGPKMTQVIAKLIIECSNGSQTIAGQKIKDFEISNKIPPDKLKNLRISVGGEIALDPIINLLEINLRENFQKPITELNDNTKNMWQKTIKFAQRAFVVRIVMSVIVFITGIWLLTVSSWEILYGSLSGEKIYGVGVSFVTGVGMMLAVVYRGPLKHIRKSMNDLGIASAAFIAYIHRVLEISHTFTFYYLKQKITFDEMKISSDLIDDAMRKTVEILNIKDTKKE